MASRLINKRSTVLASIAIFTIGTSLVDSSRSHNVTQPITPIASIPRDENGKPMSPRFPKIKLRAEQLAQLRRTDSTEYDLLVIGGGATGAGIALDAVTRGLNVALVEREDFACGTSSKSTKLVHGGVRYLEKAVTNLDLAQLSLVVEALRERRTFLEIAPHLSSSLPILLPLQHWWQVPYFWAGTKAYDFLAGFQRLESSYYMNKKQALSYFPFLKKDQLVGALVYYDGQHNDSRMNVALALTASLYGATIANHLEVTSLEKDESGRICGARVRDLLSTDATGTGTEEFVIRAKGVVNATGPFSDAIEQMDDPSRIPIVAPSSGTHVILPGGLCSKAMGMIDAASSDGRVIFVLPWQGFTLAGTTETTCTIERDPIPREDDVDFILREVNKHLDPEMNLTKAHVLAAWSGIRPLVRDPKAKNTESLVRSHLVKVSASGLLTCAGGKWTTYRQMSEDAVDEAIKAFKLAPKATTLADISGVNMPPTSVTGACCTQSIPLIGAHGYSQYLHTQIEELYPEIDADVAKHISQNYGDRAWEVLGTGSSAPSKRLLPSFPFLEAEIRHAVRSEAACTATDVIFRRIRLAFLDARSALQALPRVIDIMAEELGWSEDRKRAEQAQSVQHLRPMGLDLTEAKMP